MAPAFEIPRRARAVPALLLAVLIVLAAALLAPAPQAAALDSPARCGALAVKDGALVSAKTGKPVVLRGVSTHGLAWYPQYVNDAAFKRLRTDWGANCIRLALYTEEYGGYCAGGDKRELMKLVDAGVRYATANDMYVIIDWHTLSDGNPNTHAKAARKFFATVAKKYAKHKNVLYEICNEPNGSTTWKQVKSYAKKVIPVIRKHAKRAVILVGTPEWCQRIDQAAASPLPAKYAANVMYTFHFYAGTHKADLRKRLNAACKAGMPVFVSEYGICDASGNGGISTAQANKWMKLLDKHHVSSCIWNLSNKAESAALLKPGFSKASGFGYKNLTKSGRWAYKMLRAHR